MNEIVQVKMSYWASIIKERQESGQTIKEWCSANGISVNAYYYWLRKMRKEAISIAKAQENETPVFAEVPCSATPQKPVYALCISRGDTVIKVHNDASAGILSFLKEVMSVC